MRDIRIASRLIGDLKAIFKNLKLSEQSRELDILTATLSKMTEVIRVMNLALMGNPLTAAIVAAMMAGEVISAFMKPADVQKVVQFNVGQASNPNERGSTP